LDAQNTWFSPAGATEFSSAITRSSPNSVAFQAFSVSLQDESGFLDTLVQPKTWTDAFPGEHLITSLGNSAGPSSFTLEHGFDNHLSSNYGNSITIPRVQPWPFHTGPTYPGRGSLPFSTTMSLANNHTVLGFDPNINAQDNQYSTQGLRDNWEAGNATATGTHPLYALSMDVGQAAFERLMSDPVAAPESAGGIGWDLSNQDLSQEPLLTTGISYLSNKVPLENMGVQEFQEQQAQMHEHEDQTHWIQDPQVNPRQPSPPQQLASSVLPFTCGRGNCTKAFRRKADLVRHRKTIHGVNHILHFCPILGCAKSQGHGHGYSRDDKLTEHMWKKHGNLGFSKSR
jgi:hypothetical protein